MRGACSGPRADARLEVGGGEGWGGQRWLGAGAKEGAMLVSKALLEGRGERFGPGAKPGWGKVEKG